jgi:hypothetical protein
MLKKPSKAIYPYSFFKTPLILVDKKRKNGCFRRCP